MDTSYSGQEEHLDGEGFQPKAVHRDGWIWGLGSNNMKSGLASALIAIEAIAKAGIELAGDMSFGGVVGEIEKTAIEEFQGIEYSGYGIGMRHLVTHGTTADFALLAEPTGMRISIANMGCIWLRITSAARCTFGPRCPARRARRLHGAVPRLDAQCRAAGVEECPLRSGCRFHADRAGRMRSSSTSSRTTGRRKRWPRSSPRPRPVPTGGHLRPRSSARPAISPLLRSISTTASTCRSSSIAAGAGRQRCRRRSRADDD